MNDYFIYYGITILAIAITGLAHAYIKITYNANHKITNFRGLTGRDAARMILDKHGLNNVEITEVGGTLSDHYDPGKKVVRLSVSNFNEKTISAVAVASHECGHAIQDKEGYVFMRIRAALVPVVNFCSYAGYIAIVLGIIFGALNFVWIGIILEGVILLFQIITLPVEIDASRRALKEINMLDNSEQKRAKKVLRAAALTYVAGVLSTLLQILRLLLMFSRKRD